MNEINVRSVDKMRNISGSHNLVGAMKIISSKRVDNNNNSKNTLDLNDDLVSLLKVKWCEKKSTNTHTFKQHIPSAHTGCALYERII